MSLFDNLFGNNDSKVNPSPAITWNDLTEIKQLDEIIKESEKTPVLIFKHSTRCSISKMALRNFEQEYNIDEGMLKPYFLDLLEHRDISNKIAERFDVMHQSPQILLIKNGKAVYHTSHQDIDAGVIKEKV